MDSHELRQEAGRLNRLAATCSDPQIRAELETLAKDHLARAVAAEAQRNPFPSLARFAGWAAALGLMVIGGSIALAQWYEPQPREFVVAVEPHPQTAQHGAPTLARPAAPDSSGGHKMAQSDHNHLVTLLENFPFPH